MSVKVIIADDHSIIREGLKQLLEMSGEIEVVGEAGDGIQCLNVLKKVTADILLLDKRIVLSEDQKNILDEKLMNLKKRISEKPKVQVIYFDETSNELGGGYVSYSGMLRRIEEHPTRLIMTDRKEINVCDILDINRNA